MNLGVSLLTNRIFAGTSRDCGDGLRKWTGKTTDVTDEAIKAVFEWFMNNCKDSEFEVRFANCPYALTMRKEAEK